MRRGMMMTVLIATALCFTACNKNLDKVLFGTWSVTKVEGVYFSNGASVFTVEDASPTGFVKFEKSGKGEQDYSFTLAGTIYTQQDNFSWEANDDEIIIVRSGEPDLIWTRVSDTETMQVATYKIIVDATTYWNYTLTLEK